MDHEERHAVIADGIRDEIKNKRDQLKKLMRVMAVDLQSRADKVAEGGPVRSVTFAEQTSRIERLAAEITTEEYILRDAFENA
jgi:hypothetical protein